MDDGSKKGGLALILGGGPSADEGGEDEATLAFKALRKALDSGNDEKGIRAFKELLAACDDDPEYDSDEESEDDDADEDDDDLGL